MEKLRRIFNGAEDPRKSDATLHDFHEMPAVAVLSSLCGGQTCVDMADFAKNNEGFLRRFMRPEHGPPSRDAFSRLLRMLDPVPFAAALARFAADWAKALEAEGVRQVAIDKKSNETAALLEMPDVKGAVAAAELTAGKGGDCVLTLKGNQGSLRKDAKAWLADPGNAGKMLSHQQAGSGHGRKETRTATVCHDIGPLQDVHRRPGLAAVGKVESVRVSEGRTRAETRHCIMSRKMSPEDFLKAVRNRWAIENRLHWVLDVRMREDDLRNRTGSGPENLAAVRRLVVSIVHLMDDKLSIRRRLLRAAQAPDCRLELIANAAKLAAKL